MEKTLTISIAAYNVEDYIRHTLDSLIDESVIDDLEILVIDDGGTDHTMEIAQEYANKYPQTIFPVHKENGGYGSTINMGIEMATGKYFKQLDGDDWYCTENLKPFIEILKKVSDDCVLTYFYQYLDKTGDCICKECFHYIEEGEYEIEKSGLNERFSIKNVAYRTELLKNMSERLTEHCFYTDSEFAVYPVVYIKTVYVCHLPIYVYRIERDGQSMSVEGIKKHYKDQETVFWNVVDFYLDKVDSKESIKKKVVLYTLDMLCCDWFKFHCTLPLSFSIYKEIVAFKKQVNLMCPILIERFKNSRRARKYLIKYRSLAYPVVRVILK